MPTTYPGREDEFDLGDGHSFTWLTTQGDITIGLIEHHPLPDGQYCGGYVAWADDPASPKPIKHHLARGGPGDESSLTVTPSLLCPRCGNHGFITDGRWVSV